MHLVRMFVCQCLRYITFKAIHIPGERINDIADSLTRFQMNRFCTLTPQANIAMTPIPNLLHV